MSTTTTTSAPWKSKLHQLRWGMRGAAAVRGIFYLLLISGLLLTLGVLLDSVLRTNSLTWRLSFWSGWMVITLLAGWYFLLRPLLSQFSDLQIALQIEKRKPELDGRLSTAIELNHDDPHSPFFPLVFDDHAATQWRHVRVWPLLNHHLIITYLIGLFLLLFAGLFLLTFTPQTIPFSLQRLMLPLSEKSWPQQVQLRFINEHQEIIHNEFPPITSETVAIFQLANQNGALPDDLVIESLDPESGIISQHPFQLIAVPDRLTKIAQFSLIPRERTISLRAKGGDDQSMPWLPLPVTPALKFVTSSWQIVYPDYLDKAPIAVTDTTRNLTFPIGSSLLYRGVFEPEIDWIELRLSEQTPVLLQNESNQSEMNLKYQLNTPGRFRPEVTIHHSDQHQSDRLSQQFNIVTDSPPQIEITEPVSETFITPDAEPPCIVSVTDDWGIASISMILSPKNSREPLFEETYSLHENQTTSSLQTHIPLQDLNLSVEDQLVLTVMATDAHPEHDPVLLTRDLHVTTNEILTHEQLDRFFKLQTPLKKAIHHLDSEELSPSQKLNVLYELFKQKQNGLLPRLDRLQKESPNTPKEPLEVLIPLTHSGLSDWYENQLTPLLTKLIERERSAELLKNAPTNPDSLINELNNLRSSLQVWHDFLIQWEPYHQTGKTFSQLSLHQESILTTLQNENPRQDQLKTSLLKQQTCLLKQYDEWFLETEDFSHSQPKSHFAQFTALLQQQPEFDEIPLAMENTIQALESNNSQEAIQSASITVNHLNRLTTWYQNQIRKALNPQATNPDQKTSQPPKTDSPLFPALTAQMQRDLEESNKNAPKSNSGPGQNKTGSGKDSAGPFSQNNQPNNNTGVLESLPLPLSEYNAWGELPEKMQQRLFKGAIESTPPEYRGTVNRYFEKLSKQQTTD